MNQHISLNPVEDKRSKLKPKIRNIGIAIVFLATLCTGLGLAAVISYLMNNPIQFLEISHLIFIWSGLLTSIWTLVTGILGIAAGSQSCGDKIVSLQKLLSKYQKIDFKFETKYEVCFRWLYT